MYSSEYIVILSILGVLYVYCTTCGTYSTNMGATFDLTDLVRQAGQPAYTIEDGDLPCTIDKVA